MSTTLNEFGLCLGTLRNSLSVERNSRKLYGYDFVNYRSDCETSNANGLLKYNDVVNFGRRISDAAVHNCVMCGEFDVVIPTQNKDVCKGCDSSFWFNAKLNVTFKFCKGCKNFVTLEMFSDKPDASKCCRCRRRGRENYLTKKFIGTQDMCVTPGQSVDSPSVVSPTLSADASPEDTLASFKNGMTTASTPAACTPASAVRSSSAVPLSGPDGGCPSSAQPTQTAQPATRVYRTYKKRALSTGTPAPSDSNTFSQGIPVKPPKNPRSVSYSSDLPHHTVTPSWSNSVQPLPLSLINTPSGKIASTVTPASFCLSEGQNTGNAGRTVRFARSNSVCSSDGACAETEAFSHDQSQYLWNRSTPGPDSPEAHANTSTTPLQYYVPSSSRTPSASNYATNLPSLDARLKTEASTFFPYPYPLTTDGDAASTGSDKENAQREKGPAVDAISLLRNSCARLFSDATYHDNDHDNDHDTPEEVAVVSPAVSEAPDFSQGPSQDSQDHHKDQLQGFWGGGYHLATPGSHCKDLRRLHSADSTSTFSPPLPLSVTVMQTKGVVDHRYVPTMTVPTSSSASYITSSTPFSTLPFPTRVVSSTFATPSVAVGTGGAGQESARPESGTEEEESPERRQWEWDPSLNPLMHLAMITERI